MLPILPKASWKPPAGANPMLYILGVLATTVGLPFVILSATSPLLQAWYVRGREGARPYRFYALSNAGSFLALLSYPVLVEPHSTTRHQATGWSLAYVVFGLLCGAIAFRERNNPAPGSTRARHPDNPSEGSAAPRRPAGSCGFCGWLWPPTRPRSCSPSPIIFRRMLPRCPCSGSCRSRFIYSA